MIAKATARECMMQVYRKQSPERIPVTIYSRYLPRGSAERLARNLGLGVIDYFPLVSMLAPPWHMNAGYLSQVKGADFNITYTWENHQPVEIRTYNTPLGSVSQRTRKDPGYGSDWIEKFYISSLEDYRVVQYLVENTIFHSNANEFHARQQDLAEDGVLLARLDRSPYQKLLIELAGAERFMVDLQTNPEPVLSLLRALEQRMEEVAERVCESEADVVWLPDNITSDMTPPSMFEEHCLPYYTKLAEGLHEHNKVLIVHMDGRLRALKGAIGRSPIDAVESFSLPAVGGNLDIAEARIAWPGKLILPNFPSPLATRDEQTIQNFVEKLVMDFGTDTPFMLQVSEDIPPASWQNLLPLLCRAVGA
jgi:uncharacterized protein YheU (UPF0270 family)